MPEDVEGVAEEDNWRSGGASSGVVIRGRGVSVEREVGKGQRGFETRHGPAENPFGIHWKNHRQKKKKSTE